MIGLPTFMPQNHGVSEPAALPGHQRQSDREPGEFLRCSPRCRVSDLPGSRSCVGISQTGIWTELSKIEDTFIKPLRVGVNMSRAHYKMELHNTQEAKKSGAKGQIIVPVSVASHWSHMLLMMTSSPALLQTILCSPSQSAMRSCLT